MDTVDGQTVTAIQTTYICSDINECLTRTSCPANSGELCPLVNCTKNCFKRVLIYQANHLRVHVILAGKILQTVPILLNQSVLIVMSVLASSVTRWLLARIQSAVLFAIVLPVTLAMVLLDAPILTSVHKTQVLVQRLLCASV